MSIIKDEGDKYADAQGDKTLPVFLNGAYNLGPVIEAREATTAVLHPGMGVIHTAGAGGEDDYTEHGNDSPLSYAIVEFDKNQIEDSQTVYGIYDNIPALPYHLIPGAYLNNIECADPDTSDWEPDMHLVTEAAGIFGRAIESVLENSSTGNTEAYAAASVTGANGTAGNTQFSRIFIRNAYFTTDPSAVTYRVVFVSRGA